jgi:uncharacterized phiE125 gp8 family phage protein
MDSEAVNYLKVDEPQFDVLSILIGAATRYVEAEQGRALIAQTWDLTLDHFPLWRDEWYPYGPQAIRLPKLPLQSVTHVKYIDEAGVLQTWATPAGYVVDLAGGLIRPAFGVDYPVARAVANAVTVRFVAGPTIPAPEDKALVLQRIAYYHENREAIAEDAVNTHRVWAIG